MKLNHINLIVADVAAAVTFFERHFAFSCAGVKGENMIAILQGQDGFSLVLMAARDEQPYPDNFHIGFMQQDKDSVTAIYDGLVAHGIAAGRAPGKIRDSFGFYFTYQHIMIEVACSIQDR